MALLQSNNPVRDILPNNRSVTGIVPAFGKYESSLERDLMEILRFDSNVEAFTPQPLIIEYTDREGKKRTYTPDGLIQFKQAGALSTVPVLFEVKYRADFRKDWKLLLPKFRAAKALCIARGWRFEVFTEREIRTDYLANVRFLWPYLERKIDAQTKLQILQTLWDLDEADPDLLLCALCHNEANRARLIPALWHLIATSAIGCDLDTPLTMRTPIWPQENC